MKKILIFGCGSIGNHMSYAARRLKFQVFITDIKNQAMLRMKNIIFPKRYKKWDNKINIIDYNKVFKLKEKFDLIIIGTPPSTHLKLLNICKLKLKFKNILIEKPLTVYSKLDEAKRISFKSNYNIFCGYNHSISKSFAYFFNKIKEIENIEYIQVNWKEGWGGILGAHFWMKNEFSSYLSSSKDGGGSLQEHSHGLHLLLILLKKKNISLDKEKFMTNISYMKKSKKKYDRLVNLQAEKRGLIYKYETDLITEPADKSILIKSKGCNIQLIFNYKKNCDAVIILNNNKKKIKIFKKTRSSEFENEIKYVVNLKKKDYKKSNLNLQNAIDVMKVINKVLING